jgi:ADP-heptose:LPS heptosyltransferase
VRARRGLDVERALLVLKRLQRRFYFADYRDAELHRDWSAPNPLARFDEEVFDIAPDPATVSSILVFKPDEIGDAVYGLPAAAELKRAFPRARLFLICQRLTRPLYERTGIFDEIVAVTPTTRLTRPHLDLDDALAGLSLREFDMSVFLRTYPAYFRQYRDVPARIRLHPVDPRMRSDSVHRAHVSLWEEERAHQSLQMLQIVARATGRSYGAQDVVFPSFAWTAEDRDAEALVFGGDAPRGFIVVHPFAKHETRQYPIDYWRQLVVDLRNRIDAEVVVVGGPGDPHLDEFPAIQTQGRLSLSQTGYLASRAAAFIGVLSGPVHWAAAIGTPTVTIMSGHSLPVEWGPLGRSLILRADVPCAPCHQPTCPTYGLACLTELTPDRIVGRIATFVGEALAEA